MSKPTLYEQATDMLQEILIAPGLSRQDYGYAAARLQGLFDQVERRRGFMCKTDFEHEVGEAAGGTRVYPSVEDLQHNQKCCREGGGCGIVEVEVRLTKVIREDKFD